MTLFGRLDSSEFRFNPQSVNKLESIQPNPNNQLLEPNQDLNTENSTHTNHD